MKRKYCAFWFPTIYQQVGGRAPLLKNRGNSQISRLESELQKSTNGAFSPLVDMLEKVDISDGSIGYPYYLTLALDSAGSIYVKTEIENNKQKDEFIVKLKKEEAQEDGIVLYSFDSDCVPIWHRTKFEQSILPRDVYHRAKLFYHEHEADGEKDCGLRAYVSDDIIKIKDIDNVYLRKLLIRFSLVMEVYAREISEDNKSISELESLLDEHREDSQKIDDIRWIQWQGLIEQTQILNRKCQNASLEYTYVKNLLNSKYNKSFRYAIVPSSSTAILQDVCRTKALNIRNSAQYIENIKHINNDRISRILDSKLEESRRQQEEIKELQKESKHLQEELKALQKESRDLLEKSKVLQEKTGDSVNKLRQTEKKNSVLTKLSLFLAALFGGAQILASLVSLIAQKGENEADWVSLLAGIVLVCGVRFFMKKLAKIKSNKEDNN